MYLTRAEQSVTTMTKRINAVQSPTQAFEMEKKIIIYFSINIKVRQH
jgi:hypothetical protein